MTANTPIIRSLYRCAIRSSYLDQFEFLWKSKRPKTCQARCPKNAIALAFCMSCHALFVCIEFDYRSEYHFILIHFCRTELQIGILYWWWYARFRLTLLSFYCNFIQNSKFRSVIYIICGWYCMCAVTLSSYFLR